MKFKCIDWAYPTSSAAKLLGFATTGCWHVNHTDIEKAETTRKSGGYIDRNDPEMLAIFDEIDAKVLPGLGFSHKPQTMKTK
jgi:hypothetical protein